MEVVANPLRGQGITSLRHLGSRVVDNPTRAADLFRLCPMQVETDLIEAPRLAQLVGARRFDIKDERDRMGLGSFKALGAFHSIARIAVDAIGSNASEAEMSSALRGEVFVCASAGNHGLSLAAGARVFGAEAIIYVSESVPEIFVDRLEEKGAEVRRHGKTYEDSMAAAAREAEDNDSILLSDSSWEGYYDLPSSVMEGYLISGNEVVDQISEIPSHIFLQAGVGGFAASMAALFRRTWGNQPLIIVVEPEAARSVMESVMAGSPVVSPGPVSSMGRLDCKEASHLALATLSAEADFFVTIEDQIAERAVSEVSRHGLRTTPSGVAGIAGALSAGGRLGVTGESRCLAFVTEGAVGPA